MNQRPPIKEGDTVQLLHDGKATRATVFAIRERIPGFFHGPYAVCYTATGIRIPPTGWLATQLMHHATDPEQGPGSVTEENQP